MTAALARAVELLDRSLAYTRFALAGLGEVPGHTPTPCHGWGLDKLLAHMEDALDAYTEAATGGVSTIPTGRAPRLEAIQHKACTLLGWWLEHADRPVAVGDRWIEADVLVGAAALEITLHGWDLRVAAGHDARVPDALAGPLLGLAADLDGDRLPCLGAPVRSPAAPDDSARLLGLLGRST